MENLTVVNNNMTNETKDLGCIVEINKNASKIGYTAAYCLIFIIAVVGNSLTIYIVRTYKDMPKVPFNYLIINMAAADIIDAVFSSTYSVLYLYIQNMWIPGLFGVITCKLMAFASTISIAASVFTLMIMAIDRFRAIVCSLKKPLTFREVKMCITFIWIISGVIFCTELYRFTVFLNPHVLNNDNWYICSADYRPEGTWSIDDAKRDAIIKFFIVYAVPLLIMMMLYSAIVFFMWKRTSPGEMSDVHQKRMVRQKRKVIRMLVTIVTVFAVCWIGVHLIHFWIGFSDIVKDCLIPEALFMFLFWLSHANGAINPCIYFIFIRNFRNGLAILFKTRRREGISFASSTRSSQKNTDGATTHFASSHHGASSPKLLRVSCEDENGAAKPFASSSTKQKGFAIPKPDNPIQFSSTYSDTHEGSSTKTLINSFDDSNFSTGVEKSSGAVDTMM